MPDITLCVTDDCPKRETCYRYKANPNEFWQTYSMLWSDCQDNAYRNYIPMNEKKKDN